MTGSQIRVPFRPHRLTRVSLLVAVLMIAGAVLLQDIDWLWWAVLPALLFVSSRSLGHPPLNLDITADGLSLIDSKTTIAFDAITGLTLGGRCLARRARHRFKPLIIYHQSGTTVLPPSRELNTVELYWYLIDRIKDRPVVANEPSAKLHDYWKAQVETFGVERVRTFKGRRHFSEVVFYERCLSLYGLCGLATGIVWLMISPHREMFGTFGSVSLFAGLILLIIPQVHFARQFGPNNPSTASLVISPTGIALYQDPLLGTMRWDELTGVRMGRSSQSHVRAVPQRAIGLDAAGATLVLMDIYDVPLTVIYEHILAYWRPPGADSTRSENA